MRYILCLALLLPHIPSFSQIEIKYQCSPCGCADDGKYFDMMGDCPSCNMTLRPVLRGIELKRASIQSPQVGILIFNGADVMDVTGPLSVFEHAGFRVVTIGLSSDEVRIGHTLKIAPDFTPDHVPDIDVLVLPGGGMAESNPGHQVIQKLIQDVRDSADILFSVCSGAFFLGEAGLLEGQEATTFASLIPDLSSAYPTAIVRNDVKYTDNGKIVTSSGLSSGMDAALHVVSKYIGMGRAQNIANHMEYEWSRASDYARTQLAENFIIGLQHMMLLFSSEFHFSQGDQDSWLYKFKIDDSVQPDLVISLLEKEIMKLDNWEIKKRNMSENIQGEITHPILGKGHFNIQVLQSENKNEVVIGVNRVSHQDENSSKNYTP